MRRDINYLITVRLCRHTLYFTVIACMHAMNTAHGNRYFALYGFGQYGTYARTARTSTRLLFRLTLTRTLRQATDRAARARGNSFLSLHR